jgi:hypothetical protein
MRAVTERTEYRAIPPCILAEDQDIYDLNEQRQPPRAEPPAPNQ